MIPDSIDFPNAYYRLNSSKKIEKIQEFSAVYMHLVDYFKP